LTYPIPYGSIRYSQERDFWNGPRPLGHMTLLVSLEGANDYPLRIIFLVSGIAWGDAAPVEWE